MGVTIISTKGYWLCGGEIMVDTVLLDNYIKRGSFSDKFVADSLNIPEEEFDYKKNNMLEFKVSEIFKLCDILNIVENREKVFFA